MAWRNLGRNRRRTAINLCAIAFATLTMVFMSAMQRGSYDQMIDSAVKMQTGHLQIQAEGYLEDHDIQLMVRDLDKVYQAVDTTPGVVGAVGRIRAGFLVAKEEESFVSLVTGTDAKREREISNLPNWVKQGDFLDPADPKGAVVGIRLAKNLEAEIGDELVLVGQAVDGSVAAEKVHIRGLLDTGVPDLDRMAVFVNLEPLQQIMMMDNSASAVAILLEGHQQVAATQAALQQKAQEINDTLVALTWKQVEPGIDQSIQLDNASGKVMVYMLLLVVAFGILNTFLMSAFERFREFGVLMAIGVKPRTCASLLLIESQILVVVGFVIGLIVGGGMALYFAGAGIPLGEAAGELMKQYGLSDRIFPTMNLGIAWLVFLQVWLTTLVVALYPAFKITRFRPLEALRYQ